MSPTLQTGDRPARIGSRTRRRILLGGVCAAAASALTMAGAAHAWADTPYSPSSTAADAGLTAAGGGYAGWAMATQRPSGLQPRLAATTATTPGGVPGIDVSAYQGNVNWSSFWSKGIRFTYIKATEGTGYTNSYFNQQYTGSYNVGMIRGSYHFARPDLSSGAAQATYFVKHGGGWSSDGRTLPGALDIEQNYANRNQPCYGNSTSQNVTWMKDFLATYRRLTGRDAVIYSNSGFWSQCLGGTTAFANSNPLWLAYWSSSRPRSYFGGWGWDTFWQYSGTGSTDLDVFNGTSARLKVLATAATTTTTPPASTDTDSDGLTDAQEAKLGTDPKKKDTDGDGLGDGQEVNTLHTNPLKADTDADGLTDGQEVNGVTLPIYGHVTTNPLKADTDSDGLTDGQEVNGIQIPGYITVKTNPTSADSDGDGLSDYTEVKVGTIVYTSHYRTYSSPNAADTDQDGAPDNVEYARHTKPRSADSDRDGLTDGQEINGITMPRYGLVKTDPLKRDTDADGLTDGEEVNGILIPGYGHVRPNPTRADSDGDGLSDYTEVRTGTIVYAATRHYRTWSSPNVKDTDHDGASDSVEYARHTKPRSRDSDRDGLTDGQEINGIAIPRYGTVKPNPLKADSDGDGLSDSYEVTTPVRVKVVGRRAYYSYSSPNRKDSDRDGVSDRVERGRGTDPIRRNTDADRVSDRYDRYPLNPYRH